MCGIAAILLYPEARSAKTWQRIRAVFTQNLIYNEMRGRFATGVALFERDGSRRIHKLPLAASHFVQQDFYAEMMEQLSERTVLLLGHTRFPTQGSPLNLLNNHPIVVGHVVGVHNGHIHNDDALFEQWQLQRIAQVDSEIIFQRMAALSPLSSDNEYLTRVRDSLAQMQGPLTCLAVDSRCPTQLLALKHDNSLCVHYHPEWQALIFSSEYLYLRRTFGPGVAEETIPLNHLLCFDALRLPELQTQPSTPPLPYEQIPLPAESSVA